MFTEEVTREGLTQFIAAARTCRNESTSTWGEHELQVCREACVQYMPLETCEGKIYALKKFSNLLTIAQFALSGNAPLDNMDIAIPKPPPPNFVPSQKCCSIQGFADRLRERYSEADSLAPADELMKCMTSALLSLKHPVFQADPALGRLTMQVHCVLEDACFLLQGSGLCSLSSAP